MFDEINCSFQDMTGRMWTVTATPEKLAALKQEGIDFREDLAEFVGGNTDALTQLEILWAFLGDTATAQGVHRLEMANRLDGCTLSRGIEACGWAVLELDQFTPARRKGVAAAFLRVVQAARLLDAIGMEES